MRQLASFRHAGEPGATRHVHIEPDHASGEPGAIEHRSGRWDTLLARNPTVRRFEVASSRIDPRHDGVTIAHLTDLHVKGARTTRRLKKAIQILNRLQPDLVALTGDYVRYSKEAFEHLPDALRTLEVRSFATLGNHDHWLDAEGVTAALHLAGIDVLSNEHRTLDLRGAPFHVVGIDDRVTRHDDADRAFSGVPAEGTRLVLSHIPDVADEIGHHGGALVLSGHTHGMQVNVPPLSAPLYRGIGRHRYLRGFFRIGGQVLYVSNGIGASVPIRIASPTEVAVFVLRSTSKRS
jgi:predicted MPP superfamily phosphohydrolase